MDQVTGDFRSFHVLPEKYRLVTVDFYFGTEIVMLLLLHVQVFILL